MTPWKRIPALLGLALLLCSCASIHYTHPSWDNEQRHYLDAAMKQPLTFELDKSASDAAWSRAQVILAHVSPLKLQMVTDSVIFTYTDEDNYSWRITREDHGHSSLFDISCLKYLPGEHDCQKIKVTNRNAHLVAWYMVSAERLPDDLIWPSLKNYEQFSEVSYNPFLWGELNDKWGDFECEGGVVPMQPPPLGELTLSALNMVFSNKIDGGHAIIKPQVGNPNQVQSWALAIYDPSKRSVLRSLGANGAVPESLDWDGKLSNGSLAPEGIYPAVLKVQYQNGQSLYSTEIRLEINNRFPELSWERSLASLDARRPDMLIMPAEFNLDATFSRLSCRYRMQISWQDGRLMRTLEGAIVPGLKLVWDGKDSQGQAFISNTRYTFKVTLLDALGKPVKDYPERTWNCVFRQ